jgi:hypothetical protein
MIMITHPILGTGREKSNDKWSFSGRRTEYPWSQVTFVSVLVLMRSVEEPTAPLIAPPSAEVRVAIVATAVLYLRFVIRAGIPYSY